MKFNIHGKKLEVTDAIKNYIQEKIGRLDKYFEDPSNNIATVVIKLRGKDEQVVEVTINANTFVLRGEESHKDLYAAIDIVSDKIERQIRKNKTRIKKSNRDSIKTFNLTFEDAEVVEDNNIVKRKTIENKPMSEEEAILQMELLGHPFFVFKNVDTKEVNILYKRNDGNYGILEAK